MQIYFHSRLWSYLPRVPILGEGTVSNINHFYDLFFKIKFSRFILCKGKEQPAYFSEFLLDMRVSKQNVHFWVEAVLSWIFQQARHLSFVVAFSLHGYELLCLVALFRSACVCWCHMHMQSLRKLVDLDWDAMETEEHGWMGVCLDASRTTVGWEAQLKQSSRHLHMVYFTKPSLSTNIPVGVDSCCWCLRGSNGI